MTKTRKEISFDWKIRVGDSVRWTTVNGEREGKVKAIEGRTGLFLVQLENGRQVLISESSMIKVAKND